MSEQIVPSLAEDLLRIHRVVTRSLKVALTSGQKFAQSGFPDDSMREAFKDYEQADLSRVISEFSMKHHSPNYLVVPFILYNLSKEDRKK